MDSGNTAALLSQTNNHESPLFSGLLTSSICSHRKSHFNM